MTPLEREFAYLIARAEKVGDTTKAEELRAKLSYHLDRLTS